MVLSNVIVDVTIPRRSFVFGQSSAEVSAGFINVRSLAVAAFDLVHCSLSVLRFRQESWFTNLEQTPLNRSQQLPAPHKQTNY